MSKICSFPIADCIGCGTGLSNQELTKKIKLLERATSKYFVTDPLGVLRTYGGFEMAMMWGIC